VRTGRSGDRIGNRVTLVADMFWRNLIEYRFGAIEFQQILNRPQMAKFRRQPYRARLNARDAENGGLQ